MVEHLSDEKKEAPFRELKADEETGPLTVESLCMNCEEMGETRLLLVKIPYFKEIILSSFECEHCGERNTEIQSGAAVQKKGSKIVLKVTTPKDLNRQVVKQESASITIPEIEFEAPAFTQKGGIASLSRH